MNEIKNEQQLNIAQDFAKWARAHNEKVIAQRYDSDKVYDTALELSKINNMLLTVLIAKQDELRNLKSKVEELERELRVNKDLMTMARFIDDNK